MKTKTDPTGKRWCMLSSRDTTKTTDVVSLCQDIAFVEKHGPSGEIAQAAADALAAFLDSRVPSPDAPKDDKDEKPF